MRAAVMVAAMWICMAGSALAQANYPEQTVRILVSAIPPDPCSVAVGFRTGEAQPPEPDRTFNLAPGQTAFYDLNLNRLAGQFGVRVEVRPRVVIMTCLAALVGVVVLTVPTTRAALASLGARSKAVAAFSDTPPSPPPPTAQVAAQPAPPVPALRAPADPGSIHPVGNPGFFGWAFLDRKSGAVVGSGNSGSGTNTTESMIKAWIASDYLRMQAAAGRTPSDAALGELTLMIIDSNDDMAEKYYRMGGANAVLQRMVSMCGLTHTTLNDRYTLRLCVGQARTEERHVEAAWRLIRETAQQLEGEPAG